MQQQINFYQDRFRFARKIFGAKTLLIGSGVIMLAMLVTYVFALNKLSNVSSQLQIVSGQEKAAVERLQNLRPTIAGVSGEKNLSERLEDATHLLREKELVLSLVRGSTLGDARGFSRYLRSLANRDTDGLWLTHISLSGLGDKTQLQGQALRAELVPAYLQSLAEEPPFAEQRFHQFQIDGPEEPTGRTVTFSMTSDTELFAKAVDSQ
jgi:hypothetical protein